MAGRIEDYALIGDTHTAALVSRTGSLDWMCAPRFDSSACFSALVGGDRHGRWLLAPAGAPRQSRRRYLDDSLVLETVVETDEGAVRVVECMPPRNHAPTVVRVVEGLSGSVRMRSELTVRFQYGSVIPWVRRLGRSLSFVAGPDALEFLSPVCTRSEGEAVVADFAVSEGERIPFVLAWHPAHEPAAVPIDALKVEQDTQSWWRQWSESGSYEGEWAEAVWTSARVLKALTYAPTGGIVAAPTTSLPEVIGGVRNWDYRYCWPRDAAFTLQALLRAGFVDEARAWRDWLLRAVAGQPGALQVIYGPAGERRLPEYELPWLGGYEDSSPVRIGNGAAGQFQLDVYGEILDAFHESRRSGLEADESSWALERALLDYLEGAWRSPDEGIWEVRGPRRQFTHSKVMAWVALDRSIQAIECYGLDGPLQRWRGLREEIHREVCAQGYDAALGSFTQSYGSRRLDASLLLLALVGFLPPSDPRIRGTVAAIERELCEGAFVYRYHTDDAEAVDGLPGRDGAFLACCFWMADNLMLLGRRHEAEERFEALLAVRSDLGLLAEEYDLTSRRLVGNYPQAFSHVGLVNTAARLSGALTAARS